jgi:hypothetical protein
MIGMALVVSLLAACGSGQAASNPPDSVPAGGYPGWPGGGQVVAGTDFIPVVFSAEVAVGPSRILVAVEDTQGRFLATPAMSLSMRFYDLAADPETPTEEVEGTFRWLIPETRGVFSASATFPVAGEWGLEATGHLAGQEDQTTRVVFPVRETTQTPAIGANAPASDTPTASSAAEISVISTDTDPDPDFYRLTIRDAVASGKPTVIVFATPAFCTSGVCGPALDLVKEVAGPYKDRVNFVHVEPYYLELVNGRAQPKVDVSGQPERVRAVLDWNLPTEPYVVVVDADGKVAAKYEGGAYPDELTSTLDQLLR